MVHFLAAKSGQCTLVLVLELQAKATRTENWGEDPELQQGIIIHIMALSSDKQTKFIFYKVHLFSLDNPDNIST